ncbi:hypothetical protein BLNAU_1624 [Blattamonas nauphoetae]|uniref:Uncharacterized protein n=1 Tax=Blattamonas nauphoetae TaxID=2049346 RepID=A0ABQ9YIJ3_9EUKA|nr:hypothetical protein BLNAU_1624 [Blattamonas nauphoetae]
MTHRGFNARKQLQTWKDSLVHQTIQLDELILLQDRKKEELHFYLEDLQLSDNVIFKISTEATRIQVRMEEERITHAITSLRTRREMLLNYLSLLAHGAMIQPSPQDVQEAEDLAFDVRRFLTELLTETDDLVHDTFVDDSCANSLADSLSLIPSAIQQALPESEPFYYQAFRRRDLPETCPLRFFLPPYTIPSTVPLSLILPPFNLYAFAIENFLKSADYDSFVESPSFMTPPFPFKFKLRVWPKGLAQADSPTDIGAAIVLEEGFSRKVEQFAKTLNPLKKQKYETEINVIQKLYTFDLRIELLSEYPEKAKQSIPFPFRKEKTQQCKIGRETGWTSFVKKEDVEDGRFLWVECKAAKFLFGWRFPNYKRMAEAYHLSFLERNQHMLSEDHSIN